MPNIYGPKWFVCFKGRSGYRGLPLFPLCLTNQNCICRVSQKVVSSSTPWGCMRSLDYGPIWYANMQKNVLNVKLCSNFSRSYVLESLMVKASMDKRNTPILLLSWMIFIQCLCYYAYLYHVSWWSQSKLLVQENVVTWTSRNDLDFRKDQNTWIAFCLTWFS